MCPKNLCGLSLFILSALLSGQPLLATTAMAGYKAMTFDAASEGLLSRSVPLSVVFPADYALAKHKPMGGNWLWTTRESLDHLEAHGFTSPEEGVFQIRVARDLGHDRDTDSFVCGPKCSEADFVQKVKEIGATDVVAERHRVNGVPIFLLEATLSIASQPPTRIYMAHIALFIDTNVALFSYTPPANDPSLGTKVWAAAKKALLAK